MLGSERSLNVPGVVKFDLDEVTLGQMPISDVVDLVPGQHGSAQ